jgi:CubicO group peptidase (beta-lactamase class C family)
VRAITITGLTTSLVFSCLVVRPTSAQQDSLDRERVTAALGARIDAQLKGYETDGFAGTVLVVRDRSVVLLKGYGMANVEAGIRNTPSTRFEMNSMTKMLTGVSILQLAAAGRLNLDAPVERYLGQFPAAKRGATVRQLASHTAGLIPEGASLAGESRGAFIADVKRVPAESAPGEAYRYTNAGYSVLAAIVEVTSGMTFPEYLRKHSFALAKMTTAVFRDQVPANDERFARGYVAGPDGRPQPGPPNPYAWGTIGAGGVWCTVGDMYRWVLAVENSAVIKGPQRSLLFAPPTPPSQEAFGWHVTLATAATRMRIDKGGGSPDFASQLLYFPNERVVIVWASNNLSRRWRQTLNDALPGLIFSTPGTSR